MISIPKRLFYLCAIFAFAASCSNAPDQPAGFGSTPTDTTTLGTNSTNKTGVETITKVKNEIEGGYISEQGSPDFDEITKKNSLQPIVYGKGAAGITFETEFEDSKKILTKPVYGPNSNGEAQYNEQLYVKWRTEGDKKTPIFMLTFKGYLGKIQIQKPVGGVQSDISMDEDFSSYKGDNPRAGADKLAVDMYKAILGTDVDCLKENICSINWGDDFAVSFTIEYPGLVLLLDRDRFVSYRSLVTKTIPQGPMANHFDVFKNQFLYSEADTLKLGETFEKVEDTITSEIASLKDVEFEVNTDSFGRGYDGVFLLYQRSDFDRKAVSPKKTDKLMGINLYDQYRHGIFVDEKPVFVIETADKVMISDKSDTDLVGARVLPLQIKMGMQPQNVKPFITQLLEYFKVEAKKKYSMVSGRVSGQYQLSDIKEYSAELIAYDESTKKGIYISFGANEEKGDLGNFLTLALDHTINTADSITIPVYASEAAVEKQMVTADGVSSPQKQDKYSVLSGVPLNTLVKVTEPDFLGRKEATIELVKANMNESDLVSSLTSVLGGGERSGYVDNGSLYTPNSDNVLVPRSQHFTSVGTLGISLGLIPVASVNGVLYGRVASVTSALLNGPIKDICGLKFFEPEMGMHVDLFLSELQKFIKSENQECRYFKSKDSGSNGRVSSVYFPNDNLRVDFGDNELAQVMIWLPANNVEPLAFEGGAQ
jgi:hypothetical protein